MRDLINKTVAIMKRDWKTIPNFLSYFRLLLIPVFVIMYVVRKRYAPAVLLMAVSWITDVADGFIARRFNMVTEFGKLLDPIADKLTQLAVLLCLSSRYTAVICFLAVFVVAEIAVITVGILMLKQFDRMNSAKWHGKIATFFIEFSAAILVLWSEIPLAFVHAIVMVNSVIVIFSSVMYILDYRKLFLEGKGD